MSCVYIIYYICFINLKTTTMKTKEIKIKKVYSGFYKVYNKETKEYLGQLENGKTTGATLTGEWIAFTSNGDWIGTASTKWELVDSFKYMLNNPELY